MNSWIVGLITFGCVFGGALAGTRLRGVLPHAHVSDESKATINLITGLIATLSALVLGLLIASAKTSFDAVGEHLKAVAAKTILIDRTLAQYGPETKDARDTLRNIFAARVAQYFPGSGVNVGTGAGVQGSIAQDEIEQKIRALSPSTELQRSLQSRALQLSYEIRQARWNALEEVGSTTPWAFLAVLVFWLTVMFASFGLFAPRNRTTLMALAMGALSVSTAIFLIEEMGTPLGGIISISSAPMRKALDVLGK